MLAGYNIDKGVVPLPAEETFEKWSVVCCSF